MVHVTLDPLHSPCAPPPRSHPAQVREISTGDPWEIPCSSAKGGDSVLPSSPPSWSSEVADPKVRQRSLILYNRLRQRGASTRKRSSGTGDSSSCSPLSVDMGHGFVVSGGGSGRVLRGGSLWGVCGIWPGQGGVGGCGGMVMRSREKTCLVKSHECHIEAHEKARYMLVRST
jgi:hypothetical protein